MQYPIGRVIAGSQAEIESARSRFDQQAIDETHLHSGNYPYSLHAVGLAQTATAVGPGTFKGAVLRPLTFAPSAQPGWWIDRTDLPDQLPVEVSANNVWTTARNIVLRAGSPHNYLRMVEHIIALRIGMGVDDVTIRVADGDPPLFDESSLPLVEAMNNAKPVELQRPATFLTVKEPVTFGGTRGDFITLLPAEPGQRLLRVDCAIDFPSVIGKQRILFDLTPKTFLIGAGARTNASHGQMLYCRTIGKLFADTRNLGYTTNNILIHGKHRYANQPRFEREPVWHRAVLDLLAAVALLRGRLAGTIISYRAGHTQDVQFMTQLLLNNLLEIHHA